MTSVKHKLRQLEKRRNDAAIFGGIAGAVLGLVVSLDIAIALFSGAAGSLALWYFASLIYWEYRDSVTLTGRKKR